MARLLGESAHHDLETGLFACQSWRRRRISPPMMRSPRTPAEATRVYLPHTEEASRRIDPMSAFW